MDTYFGRRFGVMVFKNSLDKKVLLKKYVKRPKNCLLHPYFCFCKVYLNKKGVCGFL